VLFVSLDTAVPYHCCRTALPTAAAAHPLPPRPTRARHLHELDLRFHLDRSTGAVSRVLDRGARSINFVLTSLVFNVVPTLLEIGLVAGIFAAQCGWEYAGEAQAGAGAFEDLGMGWCG
jgi:ATP-binding cassette subfamily B (MDR/TAP) protein 7